MTDLSQGDIMLAAALVFGIATACQVIAPLLRVPALILLLPAGFLFGVVAPDLRVDQILGPAFPVAVELIVAVILFQGGLDLGTIPLKGSDKNVVRRLIWIGAPITWVAGTLISHFVLGLDWPIAILLGAIVVVSGPTVVTPILNFARPEPRVRGILMWEGTLLDPIGAIFAVMIFQVIRVADIDRPLEAVISLLTSWLVAIVVGMGGVLLAVLGIRLSHGNKFMGTQILIGSVLFAAGFANFLAEDSGLLAALLMGGTMHPLAKRFNASLDQAVPFFNTVTQIGIGVLFVSIAAMVPSPIMGSIVLPAIGASVIFIIVVRPIVAAIATARAGLSIQERAFIGWMDPRGIVAAATASSLSAALIATKMPGADKLLPAAFVIITVTVFVYGLTAVPVAKALGIRDNNPPPD
jgi:NhaP-type Na+/H+ or K+/H+ antiporter